MLGDVLPMRDTHRLIHAYSQTQNHGYTKMNQCEVSEDLKDRSGERTIRHRGQRRKQEKREEGR